MKARKRSRHIPIEIKNPRIVAKRVLKKVILSICQFINLFINKLKKYYYFCPLYNFLK